MMPLLTNPSTLYLHVTLQLFFYEYHGLFLVIDRFTEFFCTSMLVKRCMRVTTHTCTHTVTLLLPSLSLPLSLSSSLVNTRPHEILWHGATHTHILWETEERSTHTHTETVAHVCSQECLAGWRGFLCSALGVWLRHNSVCHDTFP